MRNDFPDHPAGPLDGNPDPDQVLEVKTPLLQAYILMGCAVAMFLIGFLVSDFALQSSNPHNAKMGSMLSWGAMLSGVVMAGIGYYMATNQKVVIRIRPDGLEFPLHGTPPLRWSDIIEINIATLVLIGAGGAKDYLVLRLVPELVPDSGSPYISIPVRMAPVAANWNVDFCISQNELDINPAHTCMEMRVRWEAAQGTAPAPPEGMSPIPGGPLLDRKRPPPTAAPSLGCLLVCGFFVLSGVGLTKRFVSLFLQGGFEFAEKPTQANAWQVLLMALLMFALAFFFWPVDDDEE